MRIIISCIIILISVSELKSQDTIYLNTDSLFMNMEDCSSTCKLSWLKNCNNAFILAEQDIKDHKINILIVGGIVPVIYTTDTLFENKYQVEYYDFGCLPAESECMYIYNKTIFEYLTNKYGQTWQKEVRKDVYGFNKWEKQKDK